MFIQDVEIFFNFTQYEVIFCHLIYKNTIETEKGRYSDYLSGVNYCGQKGWIPSCSIIACKLNTTDNITTCYTLNHNHKKMYNLINLILNKTYISFYLKVTYNIQMVTFFFFTLYSSPPRCVATSFLFRRNVNVCISQGTGFLYFNARCVILSRECFQLVFVLILLLIF